MKTYLLAISITGRRVRRHGLRQQAVEVRGGNPLLALVEDRDRGVQCVFDAATRLRADGAVVHPRRELELSRDLALDGGRRLGTARFKIPFTIRDLWANTRPERTSLN